MIITVKATNVSVNGYLRVTSLQHAILSRINDNAETRLKHYCRISIYVQLPTVKKDWIHAHLNGGPSDLRYWRKKWIKTLSSASKMTVPAQLRRLVHYDWLIELFWESPRIFAQEICMSPRPVRPWSAAKEAQIHGIDWFIKSILVSFASLISLLFHNLLILIGDILWRIVIRS